MSLFEDPKFDCDVTEFYDYFNALLRAFEIAQVQATGMDVLAKGVRLPCHSRSEWMERFEKWLDSDGAKTAGVDAMRDFARVRGLQALLKNPAVR